MGKKNPIARILNPEAVAEARKLVLDIESERDELLKAVREVRDGMNDVLAECRVFGCAKTHEVRAREHRLFDAQIFCMTKKGRGGA